MLKSLISRIFKLRASAEIKPPVDLNKPVENPELVKAIDALMTHQSEQTQRSLEMELRKATYLLPVLADEDFHLSEPDSDGQAVIEKDSVITIPLASDARNEPLLPLFTDWVQIGAWTKEPVNGWVLSATDAWDFALNGEYAGAVINPGGTALRLSKEALAELSMVA